MTIKSHNIKFHNKAQYLFESAPFKVGEGGRNALKSWSFARALVILGANRKLFIVCGREIQNSIKESVHKLLTEQIDLMGYGKVSGEDGQSGSGFYDHTDYEITGKNGTRFIFIGLKTNIGSVKSMEGIDIFLVEEGENVSQESWDVLLPTIFRNGPPKGPFGKGAELWVIFNAKLATDATYKMWVLNPPPGTKRVSWNWRDADEKGWFPEVQRVLKDHMRATDEDDYQNIWEGHPRRTLKGAIFAKELQAAIDEKRIGPQWKEDKTKPCILVFDLGDSDMCCWWAWQQIGMEHNCVGFYGNTGFGIDHYLEKAEERKHKIKYILLPHDASQAHQSARGHSKGNTIEKQVRLVYPDKVRLVPRVSVVSRINAARALFPRINFAEGPTADGIQGLTHWQYKVEGDKRSKEPLHNWASNPGDAFTYYPVWLKEGSVDAPKPKQESRETRPSSTAWMS